MSNDSIIISAALPRLERGFSAEQSKVLASLMVLQAKYESANFTSNVFKLDNNAFGYKYYVGSIYQTGQGVVSNEGDPYGSYPSLASNAMEIADWLVRRRADFMNVQSVTDYADALKKNDYFGELASSYAAGMSAFSVSLGFGSLALAVPIAIIIGLLVFKHS